MQLNTRNVVINERNIMIDETGGIYTDDARKIDPELVPKPTLCLTCGKDNAGGMEKILCTLTRSDQSGEKNFKCHAFEPKLPD